jgi:transposase-like protein
MTTVRGLRGFRFPTEVVLWAVRGYLQFPVSYRGLERLLRDLKVGASPAVRPGRSA